MKTIATLAIATLALASLAFAGKPSNPPPTAFEVVPVRVVTFNAVLQYLASKPYAETYQLIGALSADGDAANAAAKATAEAPKK